MRDLAAGVTSRVNLDVNGNEAVGNVLWGGFGTIALDADGSHIAFDSGAPNLVAGDLADEEVFVRDLSPVGPSPFLSVGDVSLGEGDGLMATANFSVRLSAPAAQTVTVSYTTTNGSAVAPADYLAKSGTVTFAPGKVAATVPVTVKGDVAVEGTETFGVTLSAPTFAVILDGTGLGTIVDDDPNPPGGGLRVGDVSVPEGDVGPGAATFTVRLSAGAAAPVSVSYTTVNGTATAGARSDFTQKSAPSPSRPAG